MTSETTLDTAELLKDAKWIDELYRLKDYDGIDKIVTSHELKQYLDERGEIKRFSTSIPTLDKAILGGMEEGQLVVLTGKTGEGKTLLMQSLTEKFVEKEIQVCWFPFEETARGFLRRFKQVPLFVLPRVMEKNTLNWVEERIKESIAKYRTKIVMIDHLDFLSGKVEKDFVPSLPYYLGEIVKQLKNIARNNHIVIIIAVHVKKVDDDKPPTINDIKDSSGIFQIADIVLLLWRRKEKSRESPTGYIDTNQAYLHVGKNRPTGEKPVINLICNNGSFAELAKGYEI